MTDKITDAQIDGTVAKLNIISDYIFEHFYAPREVEVLKAASTMLAALKAERTQPVKTLREVLEDGHRYAWVAIGNYWTMWDGDSRNSDRRAIPIPQPLPSTPEQEDESP